MPGSDLTTDRIADPRTLRTIPWEHDAVTLFNDRMLDCDNPFPCIFGVDALRKATLRFSFVDDTPDESAELAAALRDFVDMARELGNRTSLVVFFERRGGNLEQFKQRFWALMQDLVDLDDKAWPDGISHDTEHPNWEFSFAGMPMFVVANTPAHKQRQSRTFEYFAVTFQPRFVFDDIGEDSQQGLNARKIIRTRLEHYDAVSRTPLLGSFGAEGNREWVQYFLDDDNKNIPSPTDRCPILLQGASAQPPKDERYAK